jgi:hypothetical protein
MPAPALAHRLLTLGSSLHDCGMLLADGQCKVGHACDVNGSFIFQGLAPTEDFEITTIPTRHYPLNGGAMWASL